MTIHAIRALKDNFIYILENGSGEAAVIDPGEADPVHAFIRAHNLKLTHILCTHHHLDHVGGVQELVKLYGCEVAGSRYDVNLGRIPVGTRIVGETDPLKMWNREVSILDIPGHTLGQIGYYFENESAFFPGDTLFSAGCGRLFEGTPELMFNSLQKIAKLPGDTRIYFGHEYTLRNLEFVLSRETRAEVLNYKKQCEERVAQGHDTTPTTLNVELQVNPFLRAKSAAEFAEWREARNHF